MSRAYGNRAQLTREQRNTAVEVVRAMLRTNRTKGDIKKFLRKQYGLGPRSVERYMKVARERNLQAIGRTKDEAASDSIEYWRDMQGRAIAASEASRKRMEQLQGRLDKIDAEMEACDDDDPRMESLETRYSRILSALESARRDNYNANKAQAEYQDRIDRNLGNHAPQKYAPTDTKGNDLPVAKEPTSPKSESEEIGDLWKSLQGRPSVSHGQGGQGNGNGHSNGNGNGALPFRPSEN